MGAGWCPPGLMGIGIGGSADIAMRLAKEALYEPLDMLGLLARADLNAEETFRADLYRRINDLGICAQGLVGLTTVLDVKVKTAPTHASAMPVALILQCVASRVVQFAITPVTGFDLAPPAINDFPVFAEQAQEAIRVDLGNLTAVERESWQSGQRLLLSGRLLTGRDAAHERINDLLETGAPLPVSLEGRAIYCVGPVAASEAEAVGPTTATRMDKFTPRLLAETGLALMVGKAERGPKARPQGD